MAANESIDFSSAKAGTLNPATGEKLPEVAWTSPVEVSGVIDAARDAQRSWAQQSLARRIEVVEALAQAVLTRHEEISEILSNETGREPTECMMSEVASFGAYVDTAVKESKAALKTHKVSISSLDYPGKKASVEMVPRGVIGIIAPWNYPLSNFLKHLFPAVLSGNAVILKPSEFTPRSGAWLAERCAEVFPENVVQIVQGAAEVGAAVVDHVDSIAFTGSVATGRIVARQAAENLIPCSVELGGKDAAIVLADCDLQRTSLGVAQWGMHNCGQNCAAIERVYVEDAVADEFLAQLTAIVSKLRVAPGEVCDLGPLQNAAQLETVEAHVQDALERGAECLCGGKRTGRGLGYEPTVLDRCDDSMRVMTEETFGPVIAVARVKDADEAIERANASEYGLNGSIWTRDLRRGRKLLERLDVGVALLNNHAITGAMPDMPWTGVKNTGFGVAASRFAYHNFVRPKTYFVDKSKKPDPWWFPFDENLDLFGRALIERSTGSFTAMFTLAGLLGKRVKAIRSLASLEEQE